MIRQTSARTAFHRLSNRSHLPNKGGQMVCYCGHYSRVARGKRKKAEKDDAIACVLEPFESLKV